MTNIQQSIEQEVSAFVHNVSELVRRAAMEALEQAIVIPKVSTNGGKADQKRRQTSTRKSNRKIKKKQTVARSSAEIAELTEKLYEAIAAHPGETMTRLAPMIGCQPLELRVSIQKLLANGRVKKAGERHLTRYFPLDAD